MLSLDLNELDRWRTDNGDGTHNVHYPLNSDSVVMDLGGFKGIWAQQIIDFYKPNIYIIEPIDLFYSHMVDKFVENPKLKSTFNWTPQYTVETMIVEMVDHWMDVLQNKPSIR